MGCGGSKPSRQEGHTEPGVQLADVRRQPAQARVRHGDAESRPHRTTRAMTEPIRREFLTALDRAFGALDYGVIGGTALAEYGNDRATSDIDVIIPDGISDVVEEQLIRGGLVRTAGGGIGYRASDGRCYGVDITTDRAISQVFKGRSDTIALPTSRARLMPIEFLLNSKAWAYMTRIGPDATEKRRTDARDLLFILNVMTSRNLRARSQNCRWIVDYDFWTEFTRQFEGTERLLRSIGLSRDPTPSQSNRTSRRASSGSRASGSNGSRR